MKTYIEVLLSLVLVSLALWTNSRIKQWQDLKGQSEATLKVCEKAQADWHDMEIRARTVLDAAQEKLRIAQDLSAASYSTNAIKEIKIEPFNWNFFGGDALTVSEDGIVCSPNFPWFRIQLSCGYYLDLCAGDTIPDVDTPCYCGNPNHWFVKPSYAMP